ncbi:hypothetical protein ACODYM_32135 [Burkholderia gladioli]|uniref:hypothetical protein n=1 Tax=Burkholderia gladioli TaxID=28095 RepID=UPI003B5151E3
MKSLRNIKPSAVRRLYDWLLDGSASSDAPRPEGARTATAFAFPDADASDKPKPTFTLTGGQLLEALDLVAPDRTVDQLECEASFQYGDGHDGKGMYCWITEYPEEGATKLDSSIAQSIAAPVANLVMPPLTDAAMREALDEFELVCENNDVRRLTDDEKYAAQEFTLSLVHAMIPARAAVSPAMAETCAGMPDEVRDSLLDSQYLAGVTAGWNAANADDPNAALGKIHASRAGYLRPLRDWQKAGRPGVPATPATADERACPFCEVEHDGNSCMEAYRERASLCAAPAEARVLSAARKLIDLRHEETTHDQEIIAAIDALDAVIGDIPADAGEAVLTAAARDVLVERARQVSVEGWTPEHDDQYTKGELALAASQYVLHVACPFQDGKVPAFWPWPAEWWKPTTPRRDLEKAGALIQAEIERLYRAEAREQGAQAEKGGEA